MSDIRIRSPKKLENESEFLSFVESQIEQMREYTKLANSPEITFFELNKALIDYSNIHWTLVTINAAAKLHLSKVKEDFDIWYADRFIIIRNEVNPRSLTTTKWYSQKEIDMEIRVRYKEEHLIKSRVLEEADQKVAFTRRLLEAWGSHQFILSCLSKNIQSEASSLGIENSLE